jgi:hypothetical protein
MRKGRLLFSPEICGLTFLNRLALDVRLPVENILRQTALGIADSQISREPSFEEHRNYSILYMLILNLHVLGGRTARDKIYITSLDLGTTRKRMSLYFSLDMSFDFSVFFIG